MTLFNDTQKIFGLNIELTELPENKFQLTISDEHGTVMPNKILTAWEVAQLADSIYIPIRQRDMAAQYESEYEIETTEF